MRFDPDQQAIDGRLIGLSILTLTVNDDQIEGKAKVLRQGDGFEMRWPLAAMGPHAGAALILQPAALPDDHAGLQMQVRLSGLPAGQRLARFGFRIGRIDNLRAFLRSGYHSWDGTLYVPPEALTEAADDENLATGYALTQLLPWTGEGSLVLGSTRHDRFQHVFHFDHDAATTSLSVETLWDWLPHEGSVESETFVLFEHPEVEEALRLWARTVVAASPAPPRIETPRITGWCSWYNLYASIDDTTIREHLAAAREVAREDRLPMRIFQIDDGFTPEMGDWLEVRPTFPAGMRPLMDEIREAGFVPGLWIAPFLVGNRSHLFRDHPDWVVRERATGEPLPVMTLYGEFRWHKRSEEYYILDVTHPGAERYIREVFRTWRSDWGCGYFKTDFMHHGSTHGPDRVVWHDPNMTRIGFWMRMAQLIREEIGDAIWLGCGCPLWAPVGLVDGMRIGRDMGVSWGGERPAASLLRDQITRNFAHGILWQADPDCILLRDRFHEFTDGEVTALAVFAGFTGGVTMTSDHLGELSPERRGLWRQVLGDGIIDRSSFPFLGRDFLGPSAPIEGRQPTAADFNDRLIVALRERTADGPGMVFLFNTGDEEIELAPVLERLRETLPSPTGILFLGGQAETGRSRSKLTLGAHEALVLRIDG